ncbi:hypothetical protein FPZ54_03315 [Sphingomonas suaedae]|uniref:Uncharacterized protein n=1 Tax=Sphingomonas suaedae TaxID=2599297 RepID=A0A518RCG5_9SPHN|nr:hypothetical protein FPZ54_03315 [Sphingomonas suaedae]
MALTLEIDRRLRRSAQGMTASIDFILLANAGYARFAVDNSSLFCACPDISLKRATRPTAFIRGELHCVDQIAVIMSASIFGAISLLIGHLASPTRQGKGDADRRSCPVEPRLQ